MEVQLNVFIAFISCWFLLCSCTVAQLNDFLPYNYEPSAGYNNYSYNSNSFGETPGSLFRIVNEWKFLDFEYSSYTERQRAIKDRSFVPENNLPLGIDFFGNRIFITTPRWKDGVPASLSSLSFPPAEVSPPLRPYPNWEAHGDPYQPDCAKLISIYRTSVDKCRRLWAIDSGIVNATVSLNQICPPKIVAFDLQTDSLIVSYELPNSQIKQDSLHSNILANVPGDNCEETYVYVTDVWRFGLVVYSLRENRSWRITNFNFSPNPVASDFNIYGLNFQWLDGIFGLSLSEYQDNVLYFHPMASFKEFTISTTLLHDESLWANAQNLSKYFVEIGDRGEEGQSSTSGIARNGVMFFTQVHKDNVGCWDTGKPYSRNNLHLLLNDKQGIITFPNDLKVDKLSKKQGIWIMSNRLPIYLYSQLNYNEINFRVLRADIDESISGTICDPKVAASNTLKTAKVFEGQCY